MSSTNKTANYKLSQFIGADKPTFLGDYNNDMKIIDSALFSASQTAEQAVNDVESVKGAQLELKNVHAETQEQVAKLKETADGMTGDVTAAQEAANSAEQKATEAQTAATGVVNAANAASANATRAKQTADANKTTLTELESRVAAIEATPKLDDIIFNANLGNWQPNILDTTKNKMTFNTGGRNTAEFNVAVLAPSGGELYFIDGANETEKKKITKAGITTFSVTQDVVTIMFVQSAQSSSNTTFTLTLSKK